MTIVIGDKLVSNKRQGVLGRSELPTLAFRVFKHVLIVTAGRKGGLLLEKKALRCEHNEHLAPQKQQMQIGFFFKT